MSKTRARSTSVTNEVEEYRSSKIQRLSQRDPALLLCRTTDEGYASAPLPMSSFKNVVVLGDSYSSQTRANWIGYLLQKFSAELRPSVHNFARPGDTAEHDLNAQLECLFRKLPMASSVSGTTLIVIWLGINDCGHTDVDELEPIVEKIFDAMHELYIKWKGRSFLLLDVPPMHRSPGGIDLGLNDERYVSWNNTFLSQAEQFAKGASLASTCVVSSYRIISDFLDAPEAYALTDEIEILNDSASDESDAEVGGKDSDSESEDDSLIDKTDPRMAPMWEDDIHLSRAAHRVFAERVWEALRE